MKELYESGRSFRKRQGLCSELGGFFRNWSFRNFEGIKPGLERVRETSRPLCARQMSSPGDHQSDDNDDEFADGGGDDDDDGDGGNRFEG